MKLAVFDFDGTIIDSNEDIAILANMLRKELGLKERSIEEIKSFIGDGVTKLMERTFSDTENPTSYVKKYMELYRNNPVIKTKLYPKVKETFFELRDRGYIFALLTNKPEGISNKILNHFGLNELFHIVVGEDTLCNRKPDPCTINHIIDELDADKKNTYMIGDGVNDILVAKNAGVKSILCNYGYGNQEEIIKNLHPDYTINSFDELTEILI